MLAPPGKLADHGYHKTRHSGTSPAGNVDLMLYVFFYRKFNSNFLRIGIGPMSGC